MNFLAGTGHYDDFANFDTPPTDPTFEATDVPGRYRDLIGSGPFTFSVVSNPEAGQVTDPEEQIITRIRQRVELENL